MNLNLNQPVFQRYFMSLAHSKQYKFKFLRHELGLALQGRKPIYDDSLLNVEGDSWILIVHSDAILIYGENWNETQLKEIAQAFDFSRFKNFLITGDSTLIKELMVLSNVSNQVTERERLFYKATAIRRFDEKSLKIELASEDDIVILSEMLQQYYHEEYEGENDKSMDEMTGRLWEYIIEETMYVLKNSNGELLSFCTVINPDIGILFTRAQYRGKGYGKIILSYCSELLLQRNEEIYLMTVKSVLDSNSVVKKVGFEDYFECDFIRINKNKL